MCVCTQEILDSPRVSGSKSSSTSSEIPTTVNGTPETRLGAANKDDVSNGSHFMIETNGELLQSACVMTGRKKRPTQHKTAHPPMLSEPQVIEVKKPTKVRAILLCFDTALNLPSCAEIGKEIIEEESANEGVGTKQLLRHDTTTPDHTGIGY